MSRPFPRFLKFGKSETIVLVIFLLAVFIVLITLRIAMPSEAKLHAERKEMLRDSLLSVDRRDKDTIVYSDDYVGPPAYLKYRPKAKLPEGTVLDLNKADSATLTKIPGIGPAFARRICRYRDRLGGYYTVLQLQEVYGMTQERFLEIKRWFDITEHPKKHSFDSIRSRDDLRHPYINYLQRDEIFRLLRRYGRISSWSQIMRLKTITKDDSVRLSHYFYIVEPG